MTDASTRVDVDSVHVTAAELREARARFRASVLEVQEALEGRPDAEVRLTERTTLQLRGGRLLLARPGRDPTWLGDDEVPARILTLAVRALPALAPRR